MSPRERGTALDKGWPLATGAIESACCLLSADRLDITGARWDFPVPNPSFDCTPWSPTADSSQHKYAIAA